MSYQTLLADSTSRVIGVPAHEKDFAKVLARGEAKIGSLMVGSTQHHVRGSLFNVQPEHTSIYRVRQGWFALSRCMSDGRTPYISIYLQGDLVLLSKIFGDRQRDSVTAISNGATNAIEARDLWQAFIEDTDVAARCLWEMTQQEHRLHRWIVSMGHATAAERLCLSVTEWRSRLVAAGTIPTDCRSFAMPMTQAQLGAHLGLTPVHVNRVVKSMRRLGIFEIQAGIVTVEDPDALERRVESLSAPQNSWNPVYRAGGDSPDCRLGS